MDVWIIIGFIIGIIVIVKGGDFFLDAATWIAEVSGIPKFIIGATVVSLATTLPELFVSSLAAGKGEVDIALGNAIGSVTANTGLIMSIGILFMSISVVRKQFLPKGMLLLTTIATLFVLCLPGELTVTKSIFLLMLFALYIYENIKSARGQMASNEEKPSTSGKSIATNIFKFIFGTAGIVIGSQLLVDNGSAIATALKVDPRIISITMIAIGTSLPELVTTITAIVKKESSISVGNIVGANIIDTALILPVCSLISGGSIPVKDSVLYVDMPICFAIACIAIIPTIITQKFQKWQGIAALTVYIGYLVYSCAIM